MLQCITSVFDVLVAFVLVVDTCSNVHISLCLYKSDFRRILVYLYVLKTGPKVIQQQCLWLGVINCCSSHSLNLKIMWQTLSLGFLNISSKTNWKVGHQYFYCLWGRDVLMYHSYVEVWALCTDSSKSGV